MYRIEREDGEDLIPRRPLIWLPLQSFGQRSGYKFRPLKDLRRRVRTLGDTAGKGMSTFGDRTTTVFLVLHEFGYRDGVGRVYLCQQAGWGEIGSSDLLGV